MNTDTHETPALPPPEFDLRSGALWFWLAVPDGPAVGAILSQQVLHYRLNARSDGADAIALYMANRTEVDAAVLTRLRAGSVEPVILRENDFAPRVR